MFLDVCWHFRHLCDVAHFIVDNEFSQIMKGIQGERLRQAFQYFDKDGDGYIRADDFKRIVIVWFVAIYGCNSH